MLFSGMYPYKGCFPSELRFYLSSPGIICCLISGGARPQIMYNLLVFVGRRQPVIILLDSLTAWVDDFQ